MFQINYDKWLRHNFIFSTITPMRMLASRNLNANKLSHWIGVAAVIVLWILVDLSKCQSNNTCEFVWFLVSIFVDLSVPKLENTLEKQFFREKLATKMQYSHNYNVRETSFFLFLSRWTRWLLFPCTPPISRKTVRVFNYNAIPSVWINSLASFWYD